MEFQRDYFDLFDLPRRYALDAGALNSAYRTLQAEVHPDRHASLGEANRRVALQWATQVNAAYQTLRDPVQRARYLCSLRGVEVDAEQAPLPPAFLMRQMAWREAVDEAKEAGDRERLEALERECRMARRDELAALEHELDERDDTASAAAAIRRLMFLDKLESEIADAYQMIES